MNWLVLEDMAWLVLFACLCWCVACGIFAGVRFLARYFRVPSCWDGYAHGGDNEPRGFSDAHSPISHATPDTEGVQRNHG